MNKLKHLLALFSFALFSLSLSAQLTLPYLEDFSGEDDKGVVGPSPYTFDTNSVDWTIDVSSTNLLATSDYFKVVSGVFEGKDVSGEAIWMSDLIDISTVSSVDLSIDLTETGNLAGTEYIKIYYILDGGSEVKFETNGENYDDFGSLTASHDSLYGTSVQIVVRMYNIYGTRIHTFDNVSVKENISNVQSPYVLHDATNINLQWSDPASSFDEILVVANEGSALSSGIPTGDGSAYTANTTIGSGTSLLGGNVVFNSTGNSVSITGLTGGETYYISVFTRNGTEWSKGYGLSTFFNPPAAGDVILSEYVRNSNTDYSYIELFNTTATDINLIGCKMIVNNTASTSEIVDIGRDFDGVITVPANGFLILNRNRSQSDFETTWGVTLSSTGSSVNYNRTGINNFGNDKLYVLKSGGTEGTDDGVLIDESKIKTGGTSIKVYQMPLGHWTDNLVSNAKATPGSIEDYEDFDGVDLVYANGGWAGATGFGASEPSSSTGAGTALIVDGQATFADNSVVDKLTILADAGTNVANEDIVVNTTLIVEHDGSLTVTGSGSITCPTGTITVKKEGYNANTDYNIWGTPFSSAIDITSVFTNQYNCDVYVFEASSQSWKYDEDLAGSLNCNGNMYSMSASLGVSTTDGEGLPDGNFDIGRGYFIAGNSSNKVEFTKTSGALNNGDITVKVFGSSTTATDGSNDWNLISNPYPSALSLNTFLTTNSGIITNAVYLYNPGTGSDVNASYTTFNKTDDANLASGQGFYVDASTTTDGLIGTVSFTNSMRSNTNNDFRKFDSFSGIYLNATNTNNVSDKTRLYFDINANDGRDRAFDAVKMENSGFNFASKIGAEKMVFNGLAELTTTTKVIPLYFQTYESSNYTISIDSILGNLSDKDILLEDKFMKKFHDLNAKPYHFSSQPKEWNNRFYIHVIHRKSSGTSGSGTISGIEDISKNEVIVFVADNEVVISSLDSETKIISVQLVSITGQVVITKMTTGSLVKLDASSLNSGVYLVNYTLADGTNETKRTVIP